MTTVVLVLLLVLCVNGFECLRILQFVCVCVFVYLHIVLLNYYCTTIGFQRDGLKPFWTPTCIRSICYLFYLCYLYEVSVIGEINILLDLLLV